MTVRALAGDLLRPKLRIEYLAALYHPPSPSFGGAGRHEKIFLDDADGHDLIKTLGEASQKTGWQGVAA
ncbi:MAG: hypothetical protein ACLQM8_07270, partial [Limisphaerales bacterium]